MLEMTIGKACAIFLQIDSEKYTDEEKAIAIHKTMNMPTHMSITKDSMLAVIKYLGTRNTSSKRRKKLLTRETTRSNANSPKAK